MTERDLQKLLQAEPVPNELETQRRSWEVVRTAFERRERVPWARRRWRPLVAVAVAAVLVTGALSPPGRGLADRLRDALAPPPSSEPLTLPTAGRLLVVSDDGPWVVQKDGSKRLLGAYQDAVWSPHGLFVAATRGDTLVALEPNGQVRWTEPHRNRVSEPRWAPSGFRIVYRSGRSLRVIAGDGTGDRLLARSPGEAAPAWRPGPAHVLAYTDRRGRIHIVNTDTGTTVFARTRGGARATALAWTPGGSRLLSLSGARVDVYNARGRRLATMESPGGEALADVVAAPDGPQFAVTAVAASGKSSVLLGNAARPGDLRPVFSGEGRFDGVAWSPDGRWLVVGWPEADQWLFLRMPDVRRVETASAVSAEFDPGGSGVGGFPRIVGWTGPAT